MSASDEIVSMLKAVEKMALDMHNQHFERDPENGPVIPSESPNENTIYHVFNDGTVEYTKGGWAYMQRSIFTYGGPVLSDELKKFISFPRKYDKGDADSYVMLTEKEATRIRTLMSRIAQMASDVYTPLVQTMTTAHHAREGREGLTTARLYHDGAVYDGSTMVDAPIPSMRLSNLPVRERDGSSYCVLPLAEAREMHSHLRQLSGQQ